MIMNKSTLILFVTITVFSFLQIDCKKDIVDPSANDTIKPGSRNYTWTIDTLKLPYGDVFTPTRIWGSAPNDVWVTGFGDAGDLLWHFDGVRWVRDSTRYHISPSALWGTASNNIWLGNSNSTIWRYDGTKWNKFGEYSLGDYKRVSIGNIWGASENDVYGVGFADQSATGQNYRGIIIHFNGNQWQFIQLPNIKVGFANICQQRSTGLYFMEGTRFESTGDTNKLFIFNGTEIKNIYSEINYAKVEEVNGEIYFVIGKNIFKYFNYELKIWKNLNNTNMIGRMLGRTEKDFFTFTQEGVAQGIAHYNGEDLKTLYTLPKDFQISNSLIIEKDFFVICYSLNSNIDIVIHGKLQE